MDTENVSDKLNAEEKEYLDELKECLADNAQISPMERRLLDKFRDMVINVTKEKDTESEPTEKGGTYYYTVWRLAGEAVIC